MGFIGRNMFRTTVGAFRAVCPRPLSLASMDSTPPRRLHFSPQNRAKWVILGGIAAHFLLFVLGVMSKVMGDLSRAEIYPTMVAWVPADVGEGG
jgi:hypothetical protein